MISKVEGTSFLSAFCLQKYCFVQGNRLFSANYFILTRICGSILINLLRRAKWQVEK